MMIMDKMKRVKINYHMHLNYISLFSAPWVAILTKLLCSPYFFNLMVYIHELYALLPQGSKEEGLIFPKKLQLFECFRQTKFLDINVIIIGNEPYKDGNAVGIPFANPKNKSGPKSSELILIERCITKNFYNNSHDYVIDETLENWLKQGVLLLNASMTSEEGREEEHSVFWRNFTREVVKTISDIKVNSIFCLWGPQAQYFKQYIDKEYHHILQFDHPEKMVENNKDWNCTHFKEVNEILKKLKKTTIKW